eukprot:jgi/Tetstr1/462387/TSEL_007393.t1
MTRFQPFVLGLAILLMASVVQARVLSCGAGCAVGGRTVCDTYGNYVAPNVCVAMACYGATITGVQYCPDDPVKAQGDTVAEPEPEPVAPVQSGKRAAVRASSDATCEKLCGSAAFRPVCDKDGVFLANNVCEARYCVGVSVSDIRYCPDEVEAAIMEEAEEMTEDVVERANEVLAEVVREAEQAMQAEPENAEEIAEKAEQIIENVVEQADIVVEMEEEAMPAVKKTAERAEEAVGDMAEAADEMVEEMAEKAEEVAPEAAQMMEAERVVSDETCQALCSNAPTTGRMCDEDGVFVANSLCEARYCVGFTAINLLEICRDEVEEEQTTEDISQEAELAVMEDAEDTETIQGDEVVLEAEPSRVMPSQAEAPATPAPSSAICCGAISFGAPYSKSVLNVCQTSLDCMTGTHQEAKDLCENAAKVRMCTADEADAGLQVGPTCSFDVSPLSWTSTECVIEATGEAGFVTSADGVEECTPASETRPILCCADAC